MFYETQKYIRNFSIIAHIDHGKSTLADRILEITNTIPARKMCDQVLDSMELERERGITIKMQPVQMKYNGYTLNLIDTPGHIDFSYEVSRALKAVEGSILLVDSTQGVQAQTITTLKMAMDEKLKIIPVISKIDSHLARINDVQKEIKNLLKCEDKDILLVSGRTGEGVEGLLRTIIEKISPPSNTYKNEGDLRALVFDFKYSNHRGVIIFVRILDGRVRKLDNLIFSISGEKFIALEVGIFSPEEKPCDFLAYGDIGYIVTGIKKPGIASVGDTVVIANNQLNQLPPCSGYMKPMSVVFASIFPENADDFMEMKLSLGKLKLSDSAFTYEEESSGALGRGFRCGFLGMLHLEIITERLKREYGLNLIITTPSIIYEVLMKNKTSIEKIYSPSFFPNDGEIQKIFEPWVRVKIITPIEYLSNIFQLLFNHEAEIGETENFSNDRSAISIKMPLRELMRNFFDELKSVSSGYASISYEICEQREANVTRLDIIVADEVVHPFSRVVPKKHVQEEAEKTVEKLQKILPRQNFLVKIQGRALGRILASRALQPFRKDVTGYLYGGDITRKMKLWEKQKKGKKKMKKLGKVDIKHDIFLKMMKSS